MSAGKPSDPNEPMDAAVRPAEAAAAPASGAAALRASDTVAPASDGVAPASETADLPVSDSVAAPTAELPRLSPPLLAATEQALAEVLQFDAPADGALRSFFKANERLGRRDRGVIAETVFDVLRNRRRYAHLAQSQRGPLARRMMRLSMVLRFGESVMPALRAEPETEDALYRALASDPGGLPQPIRLSLPDWLHAELLQQAEAAGEVVPHAAVERLGRALLQPASLDLRVNLLKTDRETLRATLAEAGIAAEPLAEPATALRVRGKPAIERLEAFEQGWFEVQDAGSQRLVEFCAPRRGQTVVDFCAGAGGKTLALAAVMRSTGQVYACDVSKARLQRLKPRLARSGATSVQPFGIDSERDPKLRRLAARADLVLVDAPCSGTGTLRRNPELKWRMQPAAIDELTVRQAAILEAAARLVKRGGALVYATCSLLDRENDAIVAAFSKRHPGFAPPVFLRIRPDMEESDGFFAARWIRTE